MDLANSYESGTLSSTHDLKVGIAYEHNLGPATNSKYGVRAFPTYVLFVDHGVREAGRVEGANFDGVRKLIEEAGCNKSVGEGHSLGGGTGDHNVSVEEARIKRLARLGAPPESKPVLSTQEAKPMEESKGGDQKPSLAEESEDVEMTDVEGVIEDASHVSVVEGSEVSDVKDETVKREPGESAEEMVDPTESLDKAHLDTLTSSMGFSLVRAQKGLINGNGTVEGAVEWLMEHQDDEGIDEPVRLVPKKSAEGSTTCVVPQSYKCNECGKILSNMGNLELHANKSGHSDFEESTKAVKPLTAEEKAKKIEEIKVLLKFKRKDREEEEKAENIVQEKQRRFVGKEMIKTKEEMEIQARKREAKQRRKEKEAYKRERERIREELAKDKADRQVNKGKLPSTLGVEGYNPSAIQYDASADDEGDAGEQPKKLTPSAKPSAKGNPAKIDEYIKKVSSYRAGGDGQRCLKILLAYVGNVVDKPDEEKFRTVKTDNKVFKTRVKPFIGAKTLLVATGFAPNDDGNLVLKDSVDRNFLLEVKGKLEKAYTEY